MVQITVVVDTLAEPKRALLDSLKRHGPQTAKQLASTLTLSASGIRTHMSLLVVEGYVEVRSERHGVGRPTHRYTLTAAGDALFPRSYSGYLQLLLRSMERREPGSVDAAMRGMFEDRVGQLRRRAGSSDQDQTVEALSAFLAASGFIPEASVLDDGSSEVQLLNCPILDVAESYPAQCEHELWFVKEVLGADCVERTRFRLDGDSVCAYRLRTPKPA
jgi:DeoR family transcriptional regulator, suf operon transcriptional repressor